MAGGRGGRAGGTATDRGMNCYEMCRSSERPSGPSSLVLPSPLSETPARRDGRDGGVGVYIERHKPEKHFRN